VLNTNNYREGKAGYFISEHKLDWVINLRLQNIDRNNKYNAEGKYHLVYMKEDYTYLYLPIFSLNPWFIALLIWSLHIIIIRG
jgi:hypothetical protein